MLALFAHIALGADLSSSLGSALKSRGDGMVATVASCGPSLLCDALGGRGAVSVVEGSPTALALLRTEDSSEGAVAVAASDVVVLELRMADLTQRSAHCCCDSEKCCAWNGAEFERRLTGSRPIAPQ